MSVLIRGIEMPKRGMVVNIYGDGRVTNHFDEFCKTIGNAVPAPPHGRLGDLDRLEQMFAEMPFYSAEDAAQIIRLAPTIIEAEE